MYTVTFYSFKGGVGRTLALANIGLELARTGRRVLLVDFDLEAPGLDTFDILSPRETCGGLVDYVSSFAESKSSPDVRDYVYEVLGVGQQGGRLWIMPAGVRDCDYERKLSEINWARLYEDLDGFLMFEDLKTQWQVSFQPDYVLIDSRTGHTDICGICTRQLPDAVAFFFFPNEQNLVGLKPVVSSIRLENKRRSELSETHESTPIELHFVMSNVPDLDDEQEILAGLQDAFRRELNYDMLTCVVHRYDSLSLLKQSLFVIERPKSRLAREYRVLLDALTARNIQDREVVVRTLKRATSFYARIVRGGHTPDIKTDDVLRYHGRDKEVLYLLAMDLKERGRLEESQMLLAKSLELGYRSPEALLARAEARLQNAAKERDHIWNEVREAFQSDIPDENAVIKGIEILRRTTPGKLTELIDTPICRNLADLTCIRVANELMWSQPGLEAALTLLSRCGQKRDIGMEVSNTIRVGKCLALIGLRRFTDAMRLFGGARPAPHDLSIHDAFNYAIAEWGGTGKLPRDMFERVIDLDLKRRADNTANYPECLAVALWAVQKPEDAIKKIREAEARIQEAPRPEFSCWRYMKVAPPAFLEDCAAIRDLISGEQVLPRFFPRESESGIRDRAY